MKFLCLQISEKANQILDRFLPYEGLEIESCSSALTKAWTAKCDNSKGQLISKWNFGVIKSAKKPTKILDRFLSYEARAWYLSKTEETMNLSIREPLKQWSMICLLLS